MYQIEIEQPTQMGMIKQTIPQTQRMTEQYGQMRFPVAPETTQYEQICQGKKIEKDQLMSSIKGLMSQVQEILMGQEQQCGMTEQQELLRQIKDLQCQVKGLMLNEQQQQYIMPEYYNCEYPTRKYEITGESQPIKSEKFEKPITGEMLRQMIEKLILQCKIFEDMLVEKKCQIVFQMPKMEQFYFDLEYELFEQIKKKCFELEQICCCQKMEQRNMFVLMKQHIQQIEEIMCPITGMKIMIKSREQCERIMEKIIKFRCFLEEMCLTFCPETFCKRFTGIENNKMCEMIQYDLPMMGTEFYGKQQEAGRIEFLRRELEEIKMTKQQLEMRLNETNKKVDQFNRQIEMLEKMPKKQTEQYTTEYIRYTNPEEDMFQICLRPSQHKQQQQPNWYVAEPKCEMMIKPRIGEPKQIKTRTFF